MSTEHTNTSLKRRIAASSLVLSLIAGTIWLTMSLPPETAALWFGKTVEHCPNQALSCPSTQPGLLMLPLAAAIVLLILFDGE